MRRVLLATITLSTLLAGTAAAQKSDWTGQIGFGFPVAVGSTADNLGTKYGWGFGAVYSPQEKPWGVRLEVNNSRFGIENQEVIDFFDGKDGYARTWDIGLSFEAGTPKAKPARFYGIVGGAMVNRYAAVTEPAVGTGCYYDLLWGYICYPVSGDAILADGSKWNFMMKVGAGLSYKTSRRGPSLFVEATYNVAFTKNEEMATGGQSGHNTTWIPIYFGVRF